MKTVRKLLVLSLMFLLAASTSTFADQKHIVSPTDVAKAVTEHVASQDANRATIREALERPEVRDVVSSMGIDLDRITSVVDTLSGADLQQAANAAGQVNQQLVGGASNVVISTTTIIIVLLLVILIVIVAR